MAALQSQRSARGFFRLGSFSWPLSLHAALVGSVGFSLCKVLRDAFTCDLELQHKADRFSVFIIHIQNIFFQQKVTFVIVFKIVYLYIHSAIDCKASCKERYCKASLRNCVPPWVLRQRQAWAAVQTVTLQLVIRLALHHGEHRSNVVIRSLEQAHSQTSTIPPPFLWEFPVLVSDVAGQKNAPQQTFSHTVCQTHIYIHLNYKWGVGSGKWDSLWTDMWECAGAVDLPVVRSRWQRGLLHSGSLSIPAQGSTHSLLMFIAHLPSNTEGGDTRTETHWKRQYHVATETWWVIPYTQLK